MQTIELDYFNAHGGHRAAAQALGAAAPNVNRALHDALANACPGAPPVTVMTDLADHPPAGWTEPDLPNQHLVCGTDHAVLQALKGGCAPTNVHRCNGMVLRPELHHPLVIDRPRARERLGLDPHRPTGVVMFGGQGSMAMLTIARQLPHVQLVLLCGHNATLAQQLRSLNPSAPQHVGGFTSDVRHHLALGDFFIGTPGPGCFSEALQMGLPVLTVRDAWTLPQERWNTDWLRAQGVGLVGSSWQHMRPLVQLLLESLPVYRAAVRRLENNAVFDLPGVPASRRLSPLCAAARS